MAMTIFGITGCMALVVTGFGLQDAISSIIGKQYGEIDKYDITISFTSDYTDEQANANRAEYLSDNRIDDLIFTRDMKVTAEKTKGSKSINGVSILIPQDTEQMQKMIILKDAYSGKNLTLDNNGVIITQKLAETLKLSAGDTLIIETENKQYPVTVSGIAEYYILHYIYMTPELYKDVFGSVVTYNTIFASKSDTLTDSDSFKTDWLNKNPDILVISMTKMISDVFDDVLNNLNAVIVIMILSAGALAFIVVFNLTNINISERVREIATIKVLGFKNFEVDMYIFKENIILGFAGIILGIIGGYYMTKYIVSTIEIEMLMFGRKTEISSYLYAALLTLIFTVFVNLVMSFRMKNISMVESLKAIE
jgi:putative ABC transport system permease protein